MTLISFSLIILAISLSVLANGSLSTPVRVVARSKYTTAHSLGPGYKFDSSNGWQHVNASSMFHRPLNSPSSIEARDIKKSSSLYAKVVLKTTDSKGKTKTQTKVTTKNSKPKSKPKPKSEIKFKSKTALEGLGVVGVIKGVAADVWRGLKGLGRKEDVKITWYTGQDLQHPSCWPNTHWAPTDKSFAAALTIEGWENKPECFRFLELCNGAEKCIFARVVDTCAGCRQKHVDLTRAAFGALADFDTGLLTAQLRLATEPEEWYEDLWGPKAPKK